MSGIEKLEVGDILSEQSHYKVLSFGYGYNELLHLESGKHVQIDVSYIKDLMKSGDYYSKEVEVGKEDKLWTRKQIQDIIINDSNSLVPEEGSIKELGIRSIFNSIQSEKVFTVCFKKQDKPKTKKKLQQEIDTIIEQFSNSIDTVKTNKKGVANAAKNLVTELIEHPILPYEEGEDRILRGYKIQYTSRDGRYDCVDMDIEKTDKEPGIRPVNINTIKWLIYDGIKYIVK